MSRLPCCKHSSQIFQLFDENNFNGNFNLPSIRGFTTYPLNRSSRAETALLVYNCLSIGSFHVKSTTYGRHVTDFAEILHTIWDMKKNLRTRRWAFWDLRGRRYGSGKFPIIRDFEAGLYISNGSNFFVFKDSSKIFSVLNR